jgi:hypothetical protein
LQENEVVKDSAVGRLPGAEGEQMEEDPRQEAQYDPRNKRTSSVKRIRWSFVLIVLIFLALSLTAMKIWLSQ